MMKRMMSNKKKICAILAVFIGVAVGCKAPSLAPSEQVDLPDTFVGDTDTLTLASVSWKDFFPDPYLIAYIDTALAGNHSLQKAMEQIAMAQSQLKASKSALFPEFALGIGGGVQRFGEYTMDGVGNRTTNTPDLPADQHIPDPYGNFDLGLNFQWEIDIWGKLTDRKRADAMRWMQSVEAHRLVRTLLIAEVATQYYTLVGLDQKEEILKDAIAKTEEDCELTDELMKEGEVSRLSADQFHSRRLQLEEMLLDTKQQISEAEQAFALLLGKLSMEVKRSDFETVSASHFPVEAGIPAQLLRNRPDIRVAELELLAAKADLSAARKAFFPSLVIGGSGGFNAFNLQKWFMAPASLVYDMAAGITAPIFKRREIQSLWEISQSRQKTALLDYHYTVLQSYQEVVNLVTASEQMSKRKVLKQEESLIHRRSISNANELFKTGFAGYLEVLSADERYLNCELERIEMNVAYCRLHAMLYRAVGGGCF